MCYNIIVFAAVRDLDYAEKVIDLIDPMMICGRVLAIKNHYDHLQFAQVQDLTNLKIDPKDVVTVDLMSASYYFEPKSSVPIKYDSYDQNSEALQDIIPVLKKLNKINDCRKAIPELFLNGKTLDYQ